VRKIPRLAAVSSQSMVSVILVNPRGPEEVTVSDVFTFNTLVYDQGWHPKTGTVDAAWQAVQGGPAPSGETPIAGWSIEDVADAPALRAAFVSPGGVVPHAVRVTPDRFPHWRPALSRVRLGLGDAKLLVISDSTAMGDDDLAAPGHSWPNNLASLIGDGATPAAIGLATPPLPGSVDSRWTAGAGWPSDRNLGFALKAWQAVAPAGALVYGDPRVTADRFDVYYATNYPFGSITVQATGGAAQTINCSGDPGIAKVTVSAAGAATTNTVSITATGDQVFICGVEPWLSTRSTVRVGNGGVASSSTDTWIASTPFFGGLESIKAYAPDLAIVCLGTNDAINNAPPDRYLSQLQQIIDAAAVSGDVAVMTNVPAQESALVTLQAQYANAVRGLTTLPLIDLFDRCGGTWDTLNGLGFMIDQHHPNPAGHWDVAGFVKAALAQAH